MSKIRNLLTRIPFQKSTYLHYVPWWHFWNPRSGVDHPSCDADVRNTHYDRAVRLQGLVLLLFIMLMLFLAGDQ